MDELRAENFSWEDRDGYEDIIIVDAMRTYPLEAAPPGLLPAVMRAVEANPRAVYKPEPFRLSWFDYAISLFAAGMISLIFAVLINFTRTPLWFARFELQMRSTLNQTIFVNPILSFGLIGVLALVVGMIALAAIVLNQDGKRRPLSTASPPSPYRY